MKIYKLQEVDSSIKNKLLTGVVIPRPIAWITSRNEDGVLNLAPFSYFNIVSTEPPYISISIRRDEGIQKDTSRNILNTKEFVVHMVDEKNLKQVNETSYSFPSSVSEVDELHLTRTPSVSIKTEGVVESKVRLECQYVTHLNFETTDLFIGKVLVVHVAEEIMDGDKVKTEKTGVLSRLAGPNYGTIGKIIHLKKPERDK